MISQDCLSIGLESAGFFTTYKKGFLVAIDAETKLYFKELLDDHLHDMGVMVSDKMNTLETHLNGMNELKFKAIDKTLDEYRPWHKMHFDNKDLLEEKIIKIKEDLIKKIEEKSKSNTATVLVILSVLIAAGALLVSILN